MKFFGFFDKMIEKGSAAVLVFCVFVMLIISVSIIVLRWFRLGYLWMDPMVRHLVFLSTFLGGVIATGRGTHIGIDILSKFLESKGMVKIHKMITSLTSLASVLTLIWLVVASYDFFMMELKYGKVDFLGIHSSALVAIIPVGLSLLAYRFFYIFLDCLFGETEEILEAPTQVKGDS